MATPSGSKRRRLLKYDTQSASKRARKERDRLRNRTRVFLNEMFPRWRALKEDLDLKTDHEVAEFLLNSYATCKYSVALTSTPLAHLGAMPPPMPQLSSVGSCASEEPTSGNVSGIKVLGPHPTDSASAVDPKPSAESSQPDSDPFGLKAATAKEVSFRPDIEGEEYSSDSDYSYESDEFELPAMTLEEEMMSFVAEDSDDEDEGEHGDDDDDLVGYRLQAPEDIVGKPAGIAYHFCVMQLAKQIPRALCRVKSCGQPYTLKSTQKGTSILLTWICSNNHIGHCWSSQPRLKAHGVHAGDFLIATNVLLSGNNFSKISLLFDFMNMGSVAPTFFNKVQNFYCCPAIEALWMDTLDKVHEGLHGQDIILAGDGRNDSPGHSAQYCTYTVVHSTTKDIVDMAILDKREVNLKSTNMEKEALKQIMVRLKTKLNVVEMVTDAHPQIAYFMKTNYPNVKHSWDVWHGAKNFTKKLNKIASEKKNNELQPWLKDVIRHFWYSSQVADGSTDKFRNHWLGLLSHITDKHKWAFGACDHGEISEENRNKQWLKPSSEPHMALRQVMMNSRFMKTFPYYVNFRHTGFLETFQNQILMYAAKRFSFGYPVYKARCQLAALDYQQNKCRQIRTNKKGENMYRRTYSKRSGQWSAVPVRIDKKYNHIEQLQTSIVSACLEDDLPMTRRIVRSADDPRRIRPTIAGSLPPPTSQIVMKQKSRFVDAKGPVAVDSDVSNSSPQISLSESVATQSDLPSLESD